MDEHSIPKAEPNEDGNKTAPDKKASDECPQNPEENLPSAHGNKLVETKPMLIVDALLFAIIEAAAFILWQIADGLTGYVCVFVHWLSLVCISAGPLPAVRTAVKRERRIWFWSGYAFVWLLLAVAAYTIWRPPSKAHPALLPNPAWQPPELPKGCSNVVVWFGGEGKIYPVSFDSIPLTVTGKIPITNLPIRARLLLSEQPGYTRRITEVFTWITFTNTTNGRIENYPVFPNIISNRLYVDVVIPFLNERRTILMDHDYLFALTKQCPPLWDFNFSSNRNVFEIVNEFTNPVLQVVYKASNEVQVNGIFFGNTNDVYVAFDRTPVLFLPFFTAPSHHLGTNSIYNLICFTNRQNAIFKYPGIDNPGKFAE